MMADFYRDVTRMRCDLGYEQLPRCGKGSNEIWRKAGSPRSVTVSGR